MTFGKNVWQKGRGAENNIMCDVIDEYLLASMCLKMKLKEIRNKGIAIDLETKSNERF